MKSSKNYIEVNKESWNKRTEVHVKSDFYDNENFKKGKCSLNQIELDLLGDISGKSILHLQCHFGQDTISLNRFGAQITGVDLSDKSIRYAEQLAEETNATAKFVCCNIYDLKNHLNEKFDIVFASYGTIGWLPDMQKWADIIKHFLKPKGEFVFVEFHPFVWMFNDDFNAIQYNYFNTEPIIETETGTYADTDSNIIQENITWNHSISEVIQSLLNSDLNIETLKEFDYSPYPCFKNIEKVEKNKYRIKHLNNKIPMIYALKARK